jgi:hypothetical protein
MRNRWLINLALLVSVAILGWLALQEPQDNATFRKLSNVDPLSITHMRIKHKTQPVIEVEKRGSQWHMTTPYKALANNKHMNKLLSVLETPTHGQFSADRDLAQYGLDKPDVNITMNNELRLSLGDIEPIGKRRYVRVNDSVHVIGDSPFAQLTAAASLLVDTALFAKDTRITAIALPDRTFIKDADGRWQVTPEANFTADALNSFATQWLHARAVFVSDPEQPQAGKDKVIISLADNSKLRFAIVSLNTGVTLVNEDTGLHYHFAEDVGKQLLEPAAETGSPDA